MKMNVYLVGGAVRDELLGFDIKEHDYVVIGETPETMLAQGFKQVGKDFPVFLHPKTHEEYALARKERKTATGYHGFQMDISHTISLEEDLLRRDLTINAIAKSTTGELIDPYQGQIDLKNKTLRHVSDAFVEDPLRVLRVARFQAYLPDFTIHPATGELLKTICKTPNEISSLPSERIWLEINKASKHPDFHLFWQTLEDCGALTALNIQLGKSFIDDLMHSTLLGINRLLTTFWHQPSLDALLSLNPPSLLNEGARFITQQKHIILSPSQISDEEILITCQRLDPYRRYERATLFINSLPDQYLGEKAFWLNLIQALHAIDIAKVIQGSKASDRQQLIKQARLDCIKHLRESE